VIADYRMVIYNADGGEVEMCGNGIRCFAKYIWDRNLSDKNVLEIETLAGIIKPERSGNEVKVDMGEPVLDPAEIPADVQQAPPIIDFPLDIEDQQFLLTLVSMGNPHAVIFPQEDVSRYPVQLIGPMIENNPLFPKRTNVEFVNVLDRDEIIMRVWERGSGETLACGTGACASAVASMLKDLTNRTVTVRLLGGILHIEWAGNNHVYMTGPAAEVFEGVINYER